MNPRLPYHILNTAMIAGGVGFILAMLNLVKELMQFRVIDFLGVIGIAIGLKYIYGLIKPNVKDPMTNHIMARRFFYLGMAILATSLVMRKYDIAYYNVLLYIDMPVQVAALAISFSPKANAMSVNEDILDA